MNLSFYLGHDFLKFFIDSSQVVFELRVGTVLPSNLYIFVFLRVYTCDSDAVLKTSFSHSRMTWSHPKGKNYHEDLFLLILVWTSTCLT